MWPPGSADTLCPRPPASNSDLSPFDLEPGVPVASKVGYLPSKFGHARPLGSRIISYVCDGQTRQTDEQKQCLLPSSYGWGHNNEWQWWAQTKAAFKRCKLAWSRVGGHLAPLCIPHINQVNLQSGYTMMTAPRALST